MNRILLKTGLIASFLLIMVIGLKSCKKEKPTTATVSVVDTAGNVVEFAMVRLYPTPSVNPHPSIIIDDTLYTNFEGKCTFDYTESFNLGQAGFAVLDIEVLLPNATDGDDSLRGTGIIKILPETANEEDVIVFPV